MTRTASESPRNFNMTPTEGMALTELTKQLNSYTQKELDDASKRLQWGTFGPDGQRPMQVRYLNDLDTDHLENIMVTQPQITPIYKKVILHILKLRWFVANVPSAQ